MENRPTFVLNPVEERILHVLPFISPIPRRNKEVHPDRMTGSEGSKSVSEGLSGLGKMERQAIGS